MEANVIAIFCKYCVLTEKSSKSYCALIKIVLSGCRTFAEDSDKPVFTYCSSWCYTACIVLVWTTVVGVVCVD